LIQLAARDFLPASTGMSGSWISSMALMKNAGTKQTNQLVLDFGGTDFIL
jgi:hypothetical protein